MDSAKDLAYYTDIALEQAMAEVQLTGSLVPIILLLLADNQTLERLPFPPEAARLMEIGEAKTLIFNLIRDLVRTNGYRMVVIATIVTFVAYRSSSPDEQRTFMDTARDKGLTAAAEAAQVPARDAIAILAQCPDGALMTTQFFSAATRTVTFGEKAAMSVGVDGVQGRVKMYGDLREENLK